MSSQPDRHLCDACLESEYETYRHARVHEAVDRNKRWMEQFKIGTWPRWDYDLRTSTLIFSKDSEPVVVADIVVVGTVQGSQWEWAWGNPHMPVQSRDRMGDVREFGKTKQWTMLTTLFLESDEYLGWELSAISAHLLKGEGVYRCPSSGTSGDCLFAVAFNSRFTA